MKIPADKRIAYDTYLGPRSKGTDLLDAFFDTAIEMTVKYGILVEVKVTYRDDSGFDEITFESMGKSFHSLEELTRVLELKAFL